MPIMVAEQQFAVFDMLVVGLCHFSAVLLVFWWFNWGCKSDSIRLGLEDRKRRPEMLVIGTLIVMTVLILLLLLKAIADFSRETGYFLLLVLGFLTCGLGIACTFWMIFHLKWDRPWLDSCKMVFGVGLIWLLAWGMKYLVLGLIFFLILIVNGPWIKLAK